MPGGYGALHNDDVSGDSAPLFLSASGTTGHPFISQRRATLNLCLSVLIVTFGSNFQIYNTGVVNNVEFVVEQWMNASFIERYGFHVDVLELKSFYSIVASSNLLGAMLGAALTRYFSERWGRRKGLMANALINMVGALLVGFAKLANSYEMLLVGRLVLGFTVGLGFGIAGMYLTEMPPVKWRGTAGTAQQLFVGFSDFFALAITLGFLLGSETMWPYAFALPIIPSALQFLYLGFVCHDSPRYLFIAKSDEKAATAAVMFFQGPENLPGTMAELRREDLATQKAKQRQIRLWDIFARGEYRRPLIVATIVQGATTMSGITPVMSYSTDMFVEMGIPLETAELATVVVGFCNFAVPFFIIYLIDRVGRRVLFLSMLWGCLFGLIALSAFSYVARWYDLWWTGYAAIASLVFYQIMFAVGAPVSWMISSELFETHTRSYATSITGLIFWLLSMLGVLLYLPFQKTVGVEWSFTPFIASLIFAICYLTPKLPETKGKTTASIARRFRRNIGIHKESTMVESTTTLTNGEAGTRGGYDTFHGEHRNGSARTSQSSAKGRQGSLALSCGSIYPELPEISDESNSSDNNNRNGRSHFPNGGNKIWQTSRNFKASDRESLIT